MDMSDELQAFFRADSLAEEGRRRHDEYVSAEPFPHAVIDGLFPESILDAVIQGAEHPSTQWQTKAVETSTKSWCSDETTMHPDVQAMLFKLNSRPFLAFLEELTGIDGLIPDPYLSGGGLHRIDRKGFLDVHADFNINEKLGLDRRLNLLLYLNRDWQAEWGGALELWDEPLERCVQQVLPVFGRVVVFSTTDTSWHGHPAPLQCPKDRSRLSIALYYYTAGRPEHERSPNHSTIYPNPPSRPKPKGPFRKIRKRLQGFG